MEKLPWKIPTENLQKLAQIKLIGNPYHQDEIYFIENLMIKLIKSPTNKKPNDPGGIKEDSFINLCKSQLKTNTNLTPSALVPKRKKPKLDEKLNKLLNSQIEKEKLKEEKQNYKRPESKKVEKIESDFDDSFSIDSSDSNYDDIDFDASFEIKDPTSLKRATKNIETSTSQMTIKETPKSSKNKQIQDYFKKKIIVESSDEQEEPIQDEIKVDPSLIQLQYFKINQIDKFIGNELILKVPNIQLAIAIDKFKNAVINYNHLLLTDGTCTLITSTKESCFRIAFGRKNKLFSNSEISNCMYTLKLAKQRQDISNLKVSLIEIVDIY